MLRSVGSGSILLPALFELVWYVCLPTCAQGLSVPVMENGGLRTFWVLWGLLGAVCMGDTGFAGLFPHPHRVWVPEGCFSLDTLFERKSVGTFLS